MRGRWSVRDREQTRRSVVAMAIAGATFTGLPPMPKVDSNTFGVWVLRFFGFLFLGYRLHSFKY